MTQRNVSLNVGGGLALGFILLGCVGAVWTPYPYDLQIISERLEGPSRLHWLGTDMFGRDLLSRLMVGANTALTVSVSGVGLGMIFGVPLGILAATHSGRLLDLAIARWVDLVFAFPVVITAALLAVYVTPSSFNVILAVGIFNAAVFARIGRAAALAVLPRPYIQAALALGRPWPGVMMRHLLPNMAGILIVQATVQLAVAILIEAGLSFLGLGVRPPNPSWGVMLKESMSLYFTHPMMSFVPGTAIFLTVLGLNLTGDGLRTILDPKRSVRLAAFR